MVASFIEVLGFLQDILVAIGDAEAASLTIFFSYRNFAPLLRRTCGMCTYRCGVFRRHKNSLAAMVQRIFWIFFWRSRFVFGYDFCHGPGFLNVVASHQFGVNIPKAAFFSIGIYTGCMRLS
jgi:hypothetical protein